MTRPSGCLSDLDLDALRTGVLDAARAAGIEGHLEGCAGCAARREALAADAARFEERFAVPGLVAETLGAAALATLVVLPSDAPSELDPGIRTKGGAGLAVWRLRDGAVEPAADGGDYRAGDALRFRLHPGQASQALLVGVETGGKVSVYFPAVGDRSADVAPGRWTEAPGSVLLDDARGHERLFVLYADAKVSLEAVERAAGRLGDLRTARTLPVEGVRAQATFLLVKP